MYYNFFQISSIHKSDRVSETLFSMKMAIRKTKTSQLFFGRWLTLTTRLSDMGMGFYRPYVADTECSAFTGLIKSNSFLYFKENFASDNKKNIRIYVFLYLEDNGMIYSW